MLPEFFDSVKNAGNPRFFMPFNDCLAFCMFLFFCEFVFVKRKQTNKKMVVLCWYIWCAYRHIFGRHLYQNGSIFKLLGDIDKKTQKNRKNKIVGV
jgi:hypothetical protein